MSRGRPNNTAYNNRLYTKWHRTAANCYYHKMRCFECPTQHFCNSAEIVNPYGITNMKYALLMIYARNGKQGLEKFLKNVEEVTVVEEE